MQILVKIYNKCGGWNVYCGLLVRAPYSCNSCSCAAANWVEHFAFNTTAAVAAVRWSNWTARWPKRYAFGFRYNELKVDIKLMDMFEHQKRCRSWRSTSSLWLEFTHQYGLVCRSWRVTLSLWTDSSIRRVLVCRSWRSTLSSRTCFTLICF